LSDQLGNRVLTVAEGGRHHVVCELDTPSDLGFDTDGALLVATMEPARLLRLHDGRTDVVADLSAFSEHGNDMVVDRRGNAYLDAYTSFRKPQSLLVLVRPGEPPVLAADGLAYPNGMAITPDGDTLIVSETMAARLTAFDIADDGSLSNRNTWADLPAESPDGLCIDAEGAVWVGSYLNARFLRVRECGEITDTIERPGRWGRRVPSAGTTAARCCSAWRRPTSTTTGRVERSARWRRCASTFLASAAPDDGPGMGHLPRRSRTPAQ
jgi:sugar lactone lactonase YvrE